MHTIIIAALILVVPYLVLPREINKGDNSPYFSVLKSIIATLVGVLIFMVIIRMSGRGLYEIYCDSVSQVTGILADNADMRKFFGIGDVSHAEAEKQIMAFYADILKLIPGCIIVFSTLVSYVDYIILSKAQSKHKPVQLMPKFREFTFPPQTLTAMVLMYLTALILNKTGVFPNDMIYANINYLFDLVFVIQGISVIFMFCHIKRLPRVVAVIISLVLWNLVLLRQLLVILGMIDMIFNIKGFLIFKQQIKHQNGLDRRNRRK